MHFRVTGEWNGEPFNRVIEAENINDCYDHWMPWAQIAHADVTNIRIEEPKELPPDGGFLLETRNVRFGYEDFEMAIDWRCRHQ